MEEVLKASFYLKVRGKLSLMYVANKQHSNAIATKYMDNT